MAVLVLVGLGLVVGVVTYIAGVRGARDDDKRAAIERELKASPPQVEAMAAALALLLRQPKAKPYLTALNNAFWLVLGGVTAEPLAYLSAHVIAPRLAAWFAGSIH